MDRASRHVLAWRLSNTLDMRFCTEASEETLTCCGAPAIINTDQGSQFTGIVFAGGLQADGIRISIDGRGRCMDNIFIERLWRSLKYEAACLHEIAGGFTARRIIGEWIDFYNADRPHTALGGRTPAEAYRRSSSNRKIDSRGFWRPELQPEYTLALPPRCQKRWNHLHLYISGMGQRNA